MKKETREYKFKGSLEELGLSFSVIFVIPSIKDSNEIFLTRCKYSFLNWI